MMDPTSSSNPATDNNTNVYGEAFNTQPTEGEEMMEIEIKFGKGRSDFILVSYGDNPQVLAETFVEKHLCEFERHEQKVSCQSWSDCVTL